MNERPYRSHPAVRLGSSNGGHIADSAMIGSSTVGTGNLQAQEEGYATQQITGQDGSSVSDGDSRG